MKKSELFLLIFNLAYLIGFQLYFIFQRNYEFILYGGVIAILLIIVVIVQRRVKFPTFILVLLSLWGLLHMMGGGVHVFGSRLYVWIVAPLYDGTSISNEFIILKFDQVMHFYIYFVVSFVMAHLLSLTLRATSFSLYFFAALASIGVGALNEVVEFGAVVFLGKTGVGGYYNTALDLVFNTLGALIGAGVDALRRR